MIWFFTFFAGWLSHMIYEGIVRGKRKKDNVFAYTEEDMYAATCDGYDIAKKHYEFDVEDFKKFVESRVDMQDVYLPIHFFDLLDEYRGVNRKEADND